MFALVVGYDKGRSAIFTFTFILSYSSWTEEYGDLATPLRGHLVKASALPFEFTWRVPGFTS